MYYSVYKNIPADNTQAAPAQPAAEQPKVAQQKKENNQPKQTNKQENKQAATPAQSNASAPATQSNLPNPRLSSALLKSMSNHHAI